MKTNLLLLILSSFLFTSCDKEKRIEELIMECSYDAFEDNGVYFKKVISDYEALLIKDKFLADNSAKSYIQAIQNIANEKEFEKTPNKFHFQNLQEFDNINLEKLKSCADLLTDSTQYDVAKIFVYKNAINEVFSNTGNVQPALLAENMLEILTEKDFELDYYKINAFLLFSTFERIQDSSLPHLLGLGNEKLDVDLTEALKILIDDRNQIFVNDNNVNLDELNKLVRDYIVEFKSESKISFKADGKTTFESYIAVIDAIHEEIHQLHQKLANEMFNKDLESLTKEQLLEIHHIYPQDIIY